MKTVWKFEKQYKADPEKAYAEICSLESITPQAVVDLARNESSVIHNDFEWNDKIAGEKYRERQAREMLISFVIVREPESNNDGDIGKKIEIVDDNNRSKYTYKPRALQSTSKKNEYAPNIFFLENKDEYQILLDRALKELDSFRNRYRMITELEEVFEAINNL